MSEIKQKSLIENAIWNFFYTGMNLIFPLIIAPYVSRILGASNLGQVEFAKSFVLWFTTFATFGVNTYGVREAARLREDKEKLGKVFSELFMINSIFSLLSLLLYLWVIMSIPSFYEELPLFFIMSISIFLNAFNIDWFYQGIEEYSYITIRNAIVKCFSLVAIFLFVNSNGDYVIYGFISILGTSLSGIFNLINSKKYVKLSLRGLEIKRHIRKLFVFYLITFVISIYTNFDKTALGFLGSSAAVAFLTRAKMITSVAVNVSTSMSAVGMPRASYYLETNIDNYKLLIEKIPKYMMLFTIPITFGIIVLAPEIMLLLGGDEFLPASLLLRIIAIIVIFSSLSTFLQTQVLVASGNERLGLIASIISSLISILSNFILIPTFGYIGAGVSVVLAEFMAFGTRYYMSKRYVFDFLNIVSKSLLKYILSGIVMSIVVFVIKYIFNSIYLSILISSSTGAILYFLILIFLKEEIVNSMLDILLSKVRHKVNR